MSGQVVKWHAGQKEILIGRYVSILEDKKGTVSIADVVSDHYNDKFSRSNRSTLHFGFTNAIYWLRFDLANNSTENLILSVDQAFIPQVNLYYLNADGSWDSVVNGYRIPLYKKKFIDHFHLFSLAPGKKTYFMRILPIIHAIPIRIMEQNHWNLKASSQKLIYGIYAGILLFAITINAFLFISLRKTYFLNYSILVFLYLLTSALVMEGYAVYLFPAIDLMFWYKIVPVLDMPALLFYCIAFFELRKKHRKAYTWAFYSGLFCIIYLFAVPFLPLLPVLLVNQVFALLVFVLGIYIGITTGRAGNKLGYLFAAAYSIWFVLILLEAIYIQTGIPSHFSSISYVSTAIFIEAFLLAFLQAKKFAWERKADHLKQFQMEQQFQRELLNSKLEIQEQTFSQISQELHDNVGQILSLAKVQTILMEKKPAKDNKMLSDLKDNIGRAMTDLRAIARNLNSDRIIKSSLKDSITQELEQLSKIGLQVATNTEGNEKDIEGPKKLILFRIIQESLQNIIKHSKATVVTIHFNYGENELIIIVKDNGTGFDTEPATTSDGLGLQNMLSRATFIGSKVSIESIKGEGTSVKLFAPYR